MNLRRGHLLATWMTQDVYDVDYDAFLDNYAVRFMALMIIMMLASSYYEPWLLFGSKA